jgi:vacuolar-type H+-ATPase subunit F/Vma7
MTHMIIITRPEMADGFRLSGVDVRSVDCVNDAAQIVTDLLHVKEPVVLAIDDGIFNQLDPALVKQVHKSDKTLLVTIPEGPMRVGEIKRMDRVYDMIRHATGVRIKFKGELNGNHESK